MRRNTSLIPIPGGRRGVRSWSRLLLLIPLLTCSGCEFGRQWFQMSSDSMPFFGFDLLPDRRPTRPIAAGPGDEISIQTADNRDSEASDFEPRVVATRTVAAAPVNPPRQVLELPTLSRPATESTTSRNDGLGQPFPEPIKLLPEPRSTESGN
jgi:hypothetical protein